MNASRDMAFKQNEFPLLYFVVELCYKYKEMQMKRLF